MIRYLNIYISSLFFLTLLVTGSSYSQQNDTGGTGTPGAIKGFSVKSADDNKQIDEESKKLIKIANDYIYFGQANYRKGLEYYLEAYKSNPENAWLNASIGNCYLNSGRKASSVSYLQKAYDLDEHVDPKIHMLLGIAYKYNFDYDQAINQFNIHKKNIRDSMELVLVSRLIRECETSKQLVANPVRVFIDNLGDSINTEYPEYGPCVTADESQLFFSSRRETTMGHHRSPFDYQYYEDIYVSENKNGKWRRPRNIGKPINTGTNDAIVGISLDGQKMFVYRDKNGGDIFLSELKGKNWSVPHRMNKKINSDYYECSAAFSVDQRTLFFVTDHPLDSTHIGGKDIYKCESDEKGRWGKAVNLGPVVNTPFDETSVFAHTDGRTLYFSSKGHNTMGGYDIFKTELINDTFSTPENIGYPINSSDDDVSFVLTANGKKGYYASSTGGGYGDKDLYLINFLGAEKEGVLNTEDNLLALRTRPVREKVIEPKIRIKEAQPTILKGTVSDALTHEPLEATIEIIDNEKNRIISSLSSNSESGKYLISLPSGKNYGIAIKKKTYLFHSENFIIPASAEYQVIYKNIELKKLDVGSIIVLKNIFFDSGKSTLRSESYPELERIAKLMNEFSFVTIEISGHTDNIGSEEYNKKLSEERAKAVVDYLIGLSIATERLTFAGYGFSSPVASNDSEEGRQMNRRTEFKVLRTDYKPPKEVKTAMAKPSEAPAQQDSIPAENNPPK